MLTGIPMTQWTPLFYQHVLQIYYTLLPLTDPSLEETTLSSHYDLQPGVNGTANHSISLVFCHFYCISRKERWEMGVASKKNNSLTSLQKQCSHMQLLNRSLASQYKKELDIGASYLFHAWPLPCRQSTAGNWCSNWHICIGLTY